ncbi:MAG: hypothetical protein BRC29_00250 [Nanohaloarchaea archaeon SW_7_43_1]|nr:MAG: hypothetical protein BRC29_00250 [Nanohaloarchaea archaeon SW_7_43_1]
MTESSFYNAALNELTEEEYNKLNDTFNDVREYLVEIDLRECKPTGFYRTLKDRDTDLGYDLDYAEAILSGMGKLGFIRKQGSEVDAYDLTEFDRDKADELEEELKIEWKARNVENFPDAAPGIINYVD